MHPTHRVLRTFPGDEPARYLSPGELVDASSWPGVRGLEGTYLHRLTQDELADLDMDAAPDQARPKKRR